MIPSLKQYLETLSTRRQRADSWSEHVTIHKIIEELQELIDEHKDTATGSQPTETNQTRNQPTHQECYIEESLYP